MNVGPFIIAALGGRVVPPDDREQFSEKGINSTEGKAQQLLEEYRALRAEILARLRMRNTVINFTLILLGGTLTLSSQLGNNGVTGREEILLIPLVYPLLASFLAQGWINHDVRVGEISEFLRTKTERECEALTWDGHLSRLFRGRNHFIRPETVFSLGLFPGTSLLIIFLSWPGPVINLQSYVLLFLDGLAVIWTAAALFRRSGVHNESK